MTLSEAIRLGSMLHPQGFARFHGYSHDQASIVTCALGAAEDAGYRIVDMPILRMAATCPASEWCRVCHCVYDVIIHLNDEHRWTREAIADWVETIEAGIPQQEEVVACCV